MIATTKSSDEIVKASGSNLAFALAVLPPEKRDDMRVFYAFCRVIDDIADDPGFEDAERFSGLSRWRSIVQAEATDHKAGVETEVAKLIGDYQLSPDLLGEIITGMEMDIEPKRFATFEELRQYCYRVASAVGLASIEIFGYEDPQCKVYAEQLGYALQMTNIMRDVAEDAGEQRIFLATEDLGACGVTDESLLTFKPEDEPFQKLMEMQAKRANGFYAAAAAALPGVDRKSMRSAELMRSIYSKILARMQADGYRVFEKRYRLSKARMLGEFLKYKWLA